MTSRALSRRELLKTAAAAGAATACASTFAQDKPQSVAPASAPARTFYYIDGYHGGVDGHMPPDSLRNVLDGLDKFPNWKVSFEIEPYSWAVFAKSDPQSIDRLKHFLSDATGAGRVELVSGAYGQAYMWNASGECNIRQISYGLAELRAAFPGVVVDTYAVQEPCWTSCLPQLLKSFGYGRAVLKNSTCWGGYHAATLDADVMHWAGPDGTAITTVPRYAGEQLVPPASMLGAQPNTAFIDHCKDVGIEKPSGTILQDMGWAGRPWRLGMSQEVVSSMRHVTWRQYVDTIAPPPQKRWKASQEDLRVGLPWGGSVLQRIAQLVRLSENQLVQAEKIASMAMLRRGKPFPADDLRQAWKDLLWSQHHDVWIVSYNRHGNGTWATTVEAKAQAISQTCARIVAESAAALASAQKPEAAPQDFVRVFNTAGFNRSDLASIDVPDGKAYHVLDAHGQQVPCQVLPPVGNTTESARLLFPAQAPALGYATYQIAPANADQVRVNSAQAKATIAADGSTVLETELFSLTIDPAKGGSIRSLIAKDLSREFVDNSGPRRFNEFRGYFPNEDKWLSSTDTPAEVSIVEQGPLRVAAEIRGRIGPWPFVSHVSMAAGQRRIDFQTSFEFPVDPPAAARGRRQAADATSQRFRLGEPWEPQRDTVRSNRRPFYDSSFKLQALFPAALHEPTLDKNAPFDVCRAATTDTRFNAWDSIKNNVIFNWVDLLDQAGSGGLAVFSDHTTAYHLSPGEPLGLVMCYAGRGIWHDYGLTRQPRISYSILPHTGDWAKAQLWQELSRWNEPLICAKCDPPQRAESDWSLLNASNSGLEITTAFADGGDLLVRLFNPQPNSAPTRLTLNAPVRRVQLVELDGRTIRDLPIERAASSANVVTIAIEQFAVRTIRCELA